MTSNSSHSFAFSINVKTISVDKKKLSDNKGKLPAFSPDFTIKTLRTDASLDDVTTAIRKVLMTYGQSLEPLEFQQDAFLLRQPAFKNSHFNELVKLLENRDLQQHIFSFGEMTLDQPLQHPDLSCVQYEKKTKGTKHPWMSLDDLIAACVERGVDPVLRSGHDELEGPSSSLPTSAAIPLEKFTETDAQHIARLKALLLPWHQVILIFCRGFSPTSYNNIFIVLVLGTEDSSRDGVFYQHLRSDKDNFAS